MKPPEEPQEGSQDTELCGPQFPPYPGPFDIPVLVDDRKSLDGFAMTRCTYFTVQATDRTLDDWVAELRRRELPFLLLGVTAVIHRPDFSRTRFEDPADIDALFDPIEELEGVVVETAHIWLPNDLVDAVEPARGDVLRLEYDLFRSALRFQRETMPLKGLIESCSKARAESCVRKIPEETQAFRKWSGNQIAEARANFYRQRDDPDREALDWYDEKGTRHKA